jgi:hypothetical protein
MNSIVEVTKIIMNLKLEVKLDSWWELSSIRGDGGKVFNQNERRSSCRCLQSNNKGLRFWWNYASCSSLGGKIWSKGCVNKRWFQCEHCL